MKKISLTLEDIEAVIVKKEFMQVMATTLTICVLTLENGFTVTGESACVDPNNFDKDIGEKIAYENAREKIWQLEGYLLMSKLHNAEEGVSSNCGIVIKSENHSVVEDIAQVCHEAILAYKESPGKPPHGHWNELSEEQKAKIVARVLPCIQNPNVTPQQLSPIDYVVYSIATTLGKMLC